jgi:selenoprotein W-related protein
MAQELLATFEEELGGVTLIPNATGGVFEIRLAGERIFSREQAGRGVRRARPPRSSR